MDFLPLDLANSSPKALPGMLGVAMIIWISTEFAELKQTPNRGIDAGDTSVLVLESAKLKSNGETGN